MSDTLTKVEERIDYVLAHPGMSSWLKHALRTALARDPVEVANDLEILSVLLRSRADALVASRP